MESFREASESPGASGRLHGASESGFREAPGRLQRSFMELQKESERLQGGFREASGNLQRRIMAEFVYDCCGSEAKPRQNPYKG